ncbi:hypothetical protein BGZ76_008376 [Entomortierella beljakovae]|nr:hypothetical protein BGZ76_008376 [Entomortierella beljakovae]
MSSNSLANNNAVRLGAAALVGGLVVYLIWSSTSSSSTPRPPPSSSPTTSRASSTKTTTTTTTTTATTSGSAASSSEIEEKSSSKSSDSSDQVESRSRQSVDIERSVVHKSGSTLATALTIPEGEEEEEEEKEEEKEEEEEEDDDDDDVVVVERSIDRETIAQDIQHSKKETESIQGKEVDVSDISESKIVPELLPQPSTVSFEENNQGSIEVSENVKSEAKENQVYQAHNTEQPIKDWVQVDEVIKEEARENEFGTSTVQTSNVVQHEEEVEESSESTEERSATIPSSSSNTEVSIIAASSESVLPATVDVDHVEDTQTNETAKSRTSLNTNAAVFTPSWMPAPPADPESQSLVMETDPSYEWSSSFNNGESMSQSQFYEQASLLENGRVKMKSRCRFWPNCTNKACKFTHPTLYCRDPENCTFGSRCNFIHPKDLTRKPSKSGSKLTLSRKESRRQYQTSNDSMSSSIESLDFSAPQTVPVTNGGHS